MKVLVTGGAGFIGSHVVDALVGGDHDVTVIDDLSTGLGTNLRPGIPVHVLDIRSPEATALVMDLRPEVICHHAAQVSVGRSMSEPLRDLDQNVAGSLALLEAARRVGARMVYASSAAVYGEPRSVPIDEGHPTRPASNYGVSKLATEHYLHVYGRAYDIRSVVLRYSNVYGPRQSTLGEAGVIAAFCEAVQRGEPVVVHGDGRQTRDFIFVEDVARANRIAVETSTSGVFNVSTGTETSIIRVIESLEAHAGVRVARLGAPARAGDIRRSVLDPTHARKDLGWAAVVDIDAGLAATTSWFEEHAGGRDST